MEDVWWQVRLASLPWTMPGCAADRVAHLQPCGGAERACDDPPDDSAGHHPGDAAEFVLAVFRLDRALAGGKAEAGEGGGQSRNMQGGAPRGRER